MILHRTEDEAFHSQYDVFRGVWDEACELRRKKVLTRMARAIRCPVIAIHGDYDPHPAEGVNEPLSRECADFRFILLKKCGHRPWIERYAADAFYESLFHDDKRNKNRTGYLSPEFPFNPLFQLFSVRPVPVELLAVPAPEEREIPPVFRGIGGVLYLAGIGLPQFGVAERTPAHGQPPS